MAEEYMSAVQCMYKESKAVQRQAVRVTVRLIFNVLFVSTYCTTAEPHVPHVLIENGDMTLEEYDEYLHGRSDFIKATKKDSSNERKVSVSAPIITIQ